jgi:pimeloyl-ACP methyl ester carboxylesterase
VFAAEAVGLGLRLVGIDRPGYGDSPPEPGRTVGGWVPDALAVADHLDVRHFAAVGVSTGGAYALALAASPLSRARVLAVVACCALTDMRWPTARQGMSRPHALAVWDAPGRDAAITAALESHGPDGRRLMAGGPVRLPPADRAYLDRPDRRGMLDLPTLFAWGVEGYVDDRIADRDGWTTFDVSSVTCPVVVLHGTADVILPADHARHTADLVPAAALHLRPGQGHFSVQDDILPLLGQLVAAPARR